MVNTTQQIAIQDPLKMNKITNDCFLSIIDTICPLKWATTINNVSKYETGEKYYSYSPRNEYIAEFVNTTKLSYTQMWDVLSTLEKLHSTSNDKNKEQINNYFNMSSVADFADELIKIIKKIDGNIPNSMTSILRPENEYNNKTYNYMFYMKSNNKKILNKDIFIPYTHSNQTCIVCDTALPFDWPSKNKHNHGVCSVQCYEKCIAKYTTMTRKCHYTHCKTEMGLLHLESNHYLDSNTNELCINFSRHFCGEECAIDDYEDEKSYMRIDAYLDRH